MTAPALVLGATGFIGRWVARELTGRGTPVVAVVRDVDAASQLLARWDASAILLQGDLGEQGTAQDLVARVRPAVVFNLVGYGVDPVERDESLAEQLNVRLVRELAHACAEHHATLVHAGTAAEYGEVSGILDEAGPAIPTTMYGRTKQAGTDALRDTVRARGTRAVVARLFTVFGDGEREGRLFPSLLAAAASSAPIELTSGRQPRDFTWVADVARVLVDLASAPFTPGDVINVASGRLHEVKAFVAAVADETGIDASRLRFGAIPTREGEMWPSGVSVTRLTALLGAPLDTDLTAIVAAAVRDARARQANR